MMQSTVLIFAVDNLPVAANNVYLNNVLAFSHPRHLLGNGDNLTCPCFYSASRNNLR